MKNKIALLTSLSICMAVLNFNQSSVWAETIENHSTVTMSADAVLTKMFEGNQRFVHERAQHPHQSHEDVIALSSAQHPLAAILACADSRLAPELIFDLGLGDVFDVRVAGNIADKGVLGSLEYAVEHLHVPVIVVLGHEHCGAIAATLAHEHPHNDVGYIIHSIAPATHHGHDSAEAAEKNNITRVIHQLEKAPVLGEQIKAGKLLVVGSYYHMESGEVELLSPETRNHLLLGLDKK